MRLVKLRHKKSATSSEELWLNVETVYKITEITNWSTPHCDVWTTQGEGFVIEGSLDRVAEMIRGRSNDEEI